MKHISIFLLLMILLISLCSVDAIARKHKMVGIIKTQLTPTPILYEEHAYFELNDGATLDIFHDKGGLGYFLLDGWRWANDEEIKEFLIRYARENQ